MAQQRVALLGIGTMGRGMAANLLKAGFPLTVYNRTRAKAEPLAAQGATIADTPAEAAKNADVVISILADDNASRAAWLGDDGALAAMASGSTIVECGTISPEWIAELNSKASARGIGLVEAPVTGSRPQAEAGQLTFLCGCDEATLDKVRSVLEPMSKAIVHLGPVGSGGQMKLINNFLCAVQVASFAEALTWIERTSLNRAQALEVLKTGAPGSGIFNAMSQRMVDRTYEVNFLLRLLNKDVRYAEAAAAEHGVKLTTATATLDLLNQAEQQGLGEKDMSAVVEVIRDKKS
ncbi:MAG TPA: NAD(P)-dependent oxidoreductase [Edaphobacter sp.]